MSGSRLFCKRAYYTRFFSFITGLKELSLKQLFLLSFLSICSLACRPSDDDILEMEADKVLGFDISVRRSLSEVWINTSSFCRSETEVDCALLLDQLQHELNDLNPVPVPQVIPGAEAFPRITPSAATARYKQFVTDHAGEPILAVFQQIYPRILLNRYGIKTSRNYGLIAYYAEQLSISNALDFDTRADLLPILHGHIPAKQFTYLLESTLIAAMLEAQRQQREIARLQTLIASHPSAFNPGSKNTYTTSFRRKIIKEYQHSTLSANLRRLQQWQCDVRLLLQ
jgi:hypothetical protein